MQLPVTFFSPSLKNKKKTYPPPYLPPEKFLYFNIKKCLYFLKRKLFLDIRKQKLQNNFLYFLKRKLLLYFRKEKARKKFLMFQNFFIFQEKETPKKNPCISGNGNPRKLLIFQEVTIKVQKIKKHS